MIRMTVEVYSESTSLRATVCAEGIEQALSLVEACYPGGDARVIFPIEPEAFFVKGVFPVAGMVLPEVPQKVAG